VRHPHAAQRLREPALRADHHVPLLPGRAHRHQHHPGGPDPRRAGRVGAAVAGRRPPWPTGCYSLRYRLANNGANHDEIQIEWFLDDELLDTKHYGSEIYNADGTVIGDGLLPVPLAMGQHCCVGGNNRLKARIRHLGNNNQIENIRLFVHHGKGIKCCSSCSMGRSCDCGKHVRTSGVRPRG
jgi:hypothetical protein